MTTFDTGRRAEEVAAEYLKRQGLAIVAQNWRTKFCEIDIVAQHGDVVYFCEVKYRKTNMQGAGLDYITPKKLQKMQLAAEAWVHFFKWAGRYELRAIEVSGQGYQITAVIKDF